MAIAWVNVSLAGAPTQGGQVPTIVSRGAGVAGAFTLAVDLSLVKTKGQAQRLLVDALAVASNSISGSVAANPTITSISISPSSGNELTGSAIQLTLTFSQSVTVAGGTPTLTLNSGGSASYASGSGTSSLVFNYTTGSTDSAASLAATAVNLNGATIIGGGSSANLSLSGLTQTGPAVIIGWVSALSVGGVTPSTALDFVNNRYWDGGNVVSLSALVSGSPTISASGMLCNAATFGAIGNLLAAFQTAQNTIIVEVNGGTAATTAGIIDYAHVNSPIFQVNTNKARNFYAASGVTTSLDTANTAVWTGDLWIAAGHGTTGAPRQISLSQGATNTATDSLPSPASAFLGSFNGASLFNGFIKTLVVVPRTVKVGTLPLTSKAPTAVIGWSAPAPFTATNAINFTGTASISIPVGDLLYEYTQPWSVSAKIKASTLPATAGIIFTNVTTSPTFPGYEFWIDANGFLHSRIIHDISVPNYIGVIGTTNVLDGNPHVIGMSYDGSGTAAGIKMYIDGVANPTTVESDTLGGLSIIGGTQQYLIGNQTNHTDFTLNGLMGWFSFSNAVRSAGYFAANVGSVPPTVDANTQLQLTFDGVTGIITAATLTDASANAFVATLTTPLLWAAPVLQ